MRNATAHLSVWNYMRLFTRQPLASQRPTQRPVRQHLIRLAIGAALLLTLACTAGWLWLLHDLPAIDEASLRLARPTTQILDRNGHLLYEVLDSDAGKQLALDLSRAPDACVQATVATEDSRFYHHLGVDPIAIGRAVYQNMRGREIVSGGSTITQQVARTLILTPEERHERTLRRKLREAYLALRLEARFTKDEILALYLNQTYYGHFAFGLEAASQIFFAKPSAQLSRGECTLLAGLIQYPSGYNPLIEPQVAKNRQLTVLRLMEEAAFVDANESAQIAAEPLRYRTQLFGVQAPHFVVAVQEQIAKQIGRETLRNGGLRITTTLDLDLQQEAERAVRRNLDRLNCRDGTAGPLCRGASNPNRRVDNAAAVVLDSDTGEVLSMVGSPDYFDARIDGSVNAALTLRQPGSAIKPFTYAAALDPRWSNSPLTAASIVPDLPTVFTVREEDELGVVRELPYEPLNYDRTFHGPVSVRDALANSYNVPAVHVLERTGVEPMRALATEAGIHTFSGDYGLALTLGGGEVRLLELTAAYGIFDDGQRLDPRLIRSIERVTSDGETVHLWRANRTRSGQQVIAPQTAYLLTDILSDRVARLPAFGSSSPLNLSFDAAVKTGTTTDWRDNWTVGYSTERIVGVWTGNADGAPMLDVSGVDGAGPIWRDLMLAAHADAPPSFARPDGLVNATVCAPSGLLPSPNCPRLRSELFLAGTVPTAVDDQFQHIAVDRLTGERATDETPLARRDERLFWLLPTAYHEWMSSRGVSIAPPEVRAVSLAQQEDTANERGAAGEPLRLTGPVPNSRYQLHPSLPVTNQRLTIGGFAADLSAWHALRLVHNGVILDEAQNATRLSTWWTLEPGAHRFWLEGERIANGPTQRSEAATVTVEAFAP